MKKVVSTIAALSCVSAFATGHGDHLSVSAVTQVKAKSGEGSSYGSSDHRDLKWSLGEVAFYLKGKIGKAFAKTKIESTTSSTTVKDAILGYKFGKRATLRVGNFKVPTNFEYNTSASKTDFVDRGLAAAENFSRNIGAMVSGHIVKGLSYDIGQWNNKSGQGELGRDNVIAVRLRYDMGDMLHLETSWAEAQEQGDNETSTDFAAVYKKDMIMAKAQYIMVSNVSGATKDQDTWQITGGYKICDKMQALFKYELTDYEVTSGTTTTSKNLSNTTFGFNYMPEKGVKVALNYIIAGGDKEKFTGNSGDGYLKNAIAGLFQMKF